MDEFDWVITGGRYISQKSSLGLLWFSSLPSHHLPTMSEYDNEKGGKDEHVETLDVPSNEQLSAPLDEKADRRLVRKLDWNLLP